METQRMKKHTKEIMTSNDSVSVDLMMEIFKRLPVKTLMRFLCLSKLWASTIRSRYFMKLFLNESLTRPKSLVFIFRKKYLLPPYSSVCLKSTREASSSSSSTSSHIYHVTCHTRQRTLIAPSVHGLICYGPASRLVIYNPCTRRSITLPMINTGRRPIKYIGYDPIDNDYKVLCITRGMSKLRNKPGLAEEIRVLTLGSTQDSWRMIQDIIPPHSPENEELCINGVLYYRAFTGTKLNDSAIMSFDVRSEKLQLIKGPCNFRTFSKLTNHEGKLAVIFFEKKVYGIIGLWVLEDSSKEQWLKKTFVLPPDFNAQFRVHQMFRATDADTGEIIFTPIFVHASLHGAVYFDIRKNRVRKFEIEGTTEQYIRCDQDSVSSNQVDNLMFL